MPGSRVQGVYDDNNATTASAFTINGSSANPLSPVAAGNLLIVSVMYASSGAQRTITFADQASNPLGFTLVQPELVDGSSEYHQQVFILPNAPSGITGITATLDTSASFGIGMLVEEWSGLDASSPIDGFNAVNATATTATDNVSSGAATNTKQPAIVWSVSIEASRAAIPAAGTGYTSSISFNVNYTGRTEYKRVTSTGSNTATFTNTGTSGDRFLTQVVILDEALVVGKPLVNGPGISPDPRSMFRSRQLSANIPPNTLGGGVASWQAASYGQLTGVFTPPPIGLKREFGPGPSPDYERTFVGRQLATNAAVIGPLTGVASWQGGSYGNVIATASMQGLASGQGIGSGAVLTGVAAISGLASWQGWGLGALSSSALPNISGVAAGSGYAYGTLTATGALSGIASGQSTAVGTLSGAGELTGTASWQGFAYAVPLATGALIGVASWQVASIGSLQGTATLQGRANAEGQAVGTLLGSAALVGRAGWSGGGYGNVLGVGALAGIANGQGGGFARLEGAVQIAGVASGQAAALGLLLPVGAGQMQGVASGFSYSYGALTGVAHRFGYAIITAVSQNGLPVARACYVEKSASLVTAAYFDSTGFPLIPNAVRYRVDDVVSGSNIVPWTSLAPDVTNEVTITSPQNAMVSFTRASETHQVLFEVTDGNGNISYADATFDVIRVPGLT